MRTLADLRTTPLLHYAGLPQAWQYWFHQGRPSPKRCAGRSRWRNETTQKDGSDPVRSMQTQYATDGATGCAARTDYGFCLTTPSFNPSMPKMLFIVCTVPSLRPCSIS